MANEMFTTRSGRMIPVPILTVLPHVVTSLMALREDYEKRGEYLSLTGVLLDVIDKGIRTVRNQWKNGDVNKDRREFSKKAAAFMSDPAKYAKELIQLAAKYNLVKGQQVELSEAPEEELTEEQLEAATSPEASVS